MTLRVAINGFGRIGRTLLRALQAYEHAGAFTLVAINELANADAMAHLLRYDSSHGRFPGDVQQSGDELFLNGQAIALLHEPDPARLPWRALGVDIVFDCTGAFSQRAELQKHIDAGAGTVLLSQPGASDLDFTVIYGVNDQGLKPEHRLISNGSCTTNCVVPLLQTLDQQFGIDSGTITTIHAAMNDQRVIDAYHDDLRRARAAGQSIIPVDTKLALGIERILPHLHGRFEAIAVRVPTINVTAMDVSLTLHRDVSREDINASLQYAAEHALRGILAYTDAPLVSVDFSQDPHSCIVDGLLTRVSHKRLVKCLIWCDNEWGFATRMLDTARAIAAVRQ